MPEVKRRLRIREGGVVVVLPARRHKSNEGDRLSFGEPTTRVGRATAKADKEILVDVGRIEQIDRRGFFQSETRGKSGYARIVKHAGRPIQDQHEVGCTRPPLV